MKKILLLTILSTTLLTLQSCIAPAYAAEKETKSQLVTETDGTVEIPKKYKYMPEGYKDFMVIKTGWAGNNFEIIFFNNAPTVKTSDTSSSKRLEVRGTDEKLAFLERFSTLEEIKEYMDTGNTDKTLQKTQSIELYGRPEPYAISTTIPAYDDVIWQEHAGGGKLFAGMTADEILGILSRETLTILKVILIVIAGYIAVRKAISFIMGFMRGV